MEQQQGSSIMWKHSYDKHGGTVPDFVMNVTGTFRDDAMLRQITESVIMNNVKDSELLNSKSEWNYVRIPRALIT